ETMRAGIRAGAARTTGGELAAGGCLLVRGRRRRTFTKNLGGDALCHFAHGAAIAEEVRSALDVDESGSDHEPTRVDALLGGEAAERSGRTHARDAVANDGDVAGKRGGSGSVDDLAVLEYQIECRLRTR